MSIPFVLQELRFDFFMDARAHVFLYAPVAYHLKSNSILGLEWYILTTLFLEMRIEGNEGVL